MARYTGPVCKLCKRENMKLLLKGERCFTKCPIDKKEASQKRTFRRPGGRKKSEYSKRLREKQRAKRYAGILERQFRKYFAKSEKMKGLTGENLLLLIEIRLDSVVRRMGLASSQSSARQLIKHGHILVNDRCVDIPSFSVQPGDTVNMSEKMKSKDTIKKSFEENIKRIKIPSWLEVHQDQLMGKVLKLPSRDEMSVPVDEQLIVELYSK